MSDEQQKADTKRCPRCKTHKPRTEFGARKNTKDGLCCYCRACVNADRAARVPPRGVQPRACRDCGTVFTPEYHTTYYCSDSCRDRRQTTMKAETARAHYYAHWEHRRRLAREWRKNNPEKARAHRKACYYRDPARSRRWHDAWVQKNRELLSARMREYYRQRQALDPAKASARLRESGFTLIRYTYRGEVGYQADTPGRKIGPNETVIALYEFVEGRWVVFAPSVAGPMQREWAAKLGRREKFGGARRYREAV